MANYRPFTPGSSTIRLSPRRPAAARHTSFSLSSSPPRPPEARRGLASARCGCGAPRHLIPERLACHSPVSTVAADVISERTHRASIGDSPWRRPSSCDRASFTDDEINTILVRRASNVSEATTLSRTRARPRRRLHRTERARSPRRQRPRARRSPTRTARIAETRARAPEQARDHHARREPARATTTTSSRATMRRRLARVARRTGDGRLEVGGGARRRRTRALARSCRGRHGACERDGGLARYADDRRRPRACSRRTTTRGR